MKVWFMNGTERTGGVDIRFSPSPKYLITRCSNSTWTKLSATPPANQDKIWKITLTRNPGIRLTIHCNGVEMVNILMSNSTCRVQEWEDWWMRRVDGIRFHAKDTMSDYFYNTIRQGMPYVNCSPQIICTSRSYNKLVHRTADDLEILPIVTKIMFYVFSTHMKTIPFYLFSR
jgi:hypothetical protein